MSEQWLALAEGPFWVWEWTPGPVQKRRGNRARMVRSWGLVPMMSSSRKKRSGASSVCMSMEGESLRPPREEVRTPGR